MIQQIYWENELRDYLTKFGWVNDKDDKTTLGFKFQDENGDTWIRDYEKSTRKFVQYNGDQKINLIRND